MIKAVLFDLDGTLMDTSEGIFHTSQYTVSMLGYSPCEDMKRLRRFVGPPLKECFRIVYGFEDDELLEKCVEVYRKEYEKTGMHLCHLYGGIEDVILRLRSQGLKTGVCTLKYEKLSKMIFEEKGISALFDTVHGTDNRGKITKTDCILLSVADLGLEKDEVLMVGDTVNDLEGARNAGVNFAAATWGFGFERGGSVDYGVTVDCPYDILKLV